MSLASQLDDYFQKIESGAYSDDYDLEVNFLLKPEVLSNALGSHPICEYFDGLVLDDPNTSNFHILIRRPPLEGYVLHLSHDGDSRIIYESLASLLSAVDTAKETNTPLYEIRPESSPIVRDQSMLSEMINALVVDYETEIALCLIPSMDMTDFDLLTRLATDQDFYLGEAVANTIALRPSQELKPIALLCSKHSHPQVANAGVSALEAIAHEH